MPGSLVSLTTTWEYDDTSGGQLGVGQLTAESVQLDSESSPGFLRTYTFGASDYGRLSSAVTTIEDTGTQVYTTAFTY
ncbi:MAG TPA: hypothetical protein VI566_12635, partial [Xanthomonadales bacterium]|nr:hypothetical protein [Xanthomonadales bacterium]